MTDWLTIYSPGTLVKIGIRGEEHDEGISAILGPAMIDGTDISYKAVWWAGRERKEVWIKADEILSLNHDPADTPPSPKRIGFK